jgi:hypothetical protein
MESLICVGVELDLMPMALFSPLLQITRISKLMKDQRAINGQGHQRIVVSCNNAARQVFLSCNDAARQVSFLINVGIVTTVQNR